MSAPPTIVWLRRDLRVSDNPALEAAAAQGGPVMPVYLTEWERADPWAPGEAARWWLRASISRLREALARRGAALQMVGGEPVDALAELARVTGAREVVWNRLYEPHCRELERRVEASLSRVGVGSRSLPGALLFEPEEHLSRAGRPFVQFGAFWRSCLSLPEPPWPQTAPARFHGVPPSTDVGTAYPKQDDFHTRTAWAPQVVEPAGGWDPGEEGARIRLERFLETTLAEYETSRDFPGIEGVSRLSPHLHFGEISVREVWHRVRDSARLQEMGRAGGGAAFLRQLGWREFAHYLLHHFPHTPTEPFRAEFAAFPWADDPDGLTAWQRGETGHPLVDAGMRQLLAEGWMHNRVRMVVASFLTKDLMIPWQQGAAWFWDRLVDADLANNTLGWQWTAGSGPDAAPYFRIYNPALQAKRFDRDGIYVGRWISREHPGAGEEEGYPAPIVDHAAARLRALAAFRGLRGR